MQIKPYRHPGPANPVRLKKPPPQPDPEKPILYKAMGPQLPYFRHEMVTGPPLKAGLARLTTLPGLMHTGTNLLGLAGSAYGFATARQYWRNGQRFEALADTLGASFGLAESLLAFRGGSPAIPILAGLGALSDAAKDTYWGSRYGLQEKLGTGFFKGAGGALLIAAGMTVSPALTVAGSLLYTGAIVYDNRREIAAIPGWIGNQLG